MAVLLPDHRGFCIPISVTVNAPIDVVWDAIVDIASWPAIYPGVVETSCIQSQVNSGKADLNYCGSQLLLGSRWKITRRGVLERQRYSSIVTVTQLSEEVDKRSFTLSSHEVLGASFSLKMSVESLAVAESSKHSTREGSDSATTATTSNNSNDPQQPPSNRDDQDTKLSPPSAECCQVTFITTMIPYKFFVKLLGILCCPCLLQYRIRISMESDMKDLILYCERQVSTDDSGGGCVIDKAKEGHKRRKRWRLLMM